MNARDIKIFVMTVMLCGLLLFAGSAEAQSVRELVGKGNDLFASEQYDKAIEMYDKALKADPDCLEAVYDRANCYIRQGDLDEAVDDLKKVAAQSEDADLVARAKYNLGNCYYVLGMEKKQSQDEKDVEQALAKFKDSLKNWRSAAQYSADPSLAGNMELAAMNIRELRGIQRQQQRQKQQDKENQEDQDKEDEEDKDRKDKDSDQKDKDSDKKDKDKHQGEQDKDKKDDKGSDKDKKPGDDKDKQDEKKSGADKKPSDEDKQSDQKDKQQSQAQKQKSGQKSDQRQAEKVREEKLKEAALKEAQKILDEHEKQQKQRIIYQQKRNKVEKDW